MKLLNGGNVVRLAVEQIRVEQRLRVVGDIQVDTLILMAEDTGITTPIHVRKVKGEYVLIDGAHRLAAAKRMGFPDIAALLVECRADEARAMEASNNLGAARMTPLQTAVFVASWKRDYYAMHPERKQGVFKGNQHTGKVVEEITSLTTTIADSFGVTDRQIRNILRAGECLTPDEAAQLETSPNRITMKDLQDLATIDEPGDRSMVVMRLASGKAKSASAARKSLLIESGALQVPVKNPVEDGFNELMKAFDRAPKEALRRFLTVRFEDIAPLVEEIAEARAPKVVPLRPDQPGEGPVGFSSRRSGEAG